MPIKSNDLVFETGIITTDSSGEATITLNCFLPDETPSVIMSAFGAIENVNANLTSLALVGSTWTAKIITSAPNTTVSYHAVTATTGDADPPNLVSQNFAYILTQNNEQIQIQGP